jgi:hypothetical protein
MLVQMQQKLRQKISQTPAVGSEKPRDAVKLVLYQEKTADLLRQLRLLPQDGQHFLVQFVYSWVVKLDEVVAVGLRVLPSQHQHPHEEQAASHHAQKYPHGCAR